MTDSLPDKDIDLNTEKEEGMEDKNDMFVSAMDSPSDSGLEINKTSQSDTMEDLSLQVGDTPAGDGSMSLFSLLG